MCVTGLPEVLEVLEQGLIFKSTRLNVCSFCKEREIVLDQQSANFFCKGPGLIFLAFGPHKSLLQPLSSIV